MPDPAMIISGPSRSFSSCDSSPVAENLTVSRPFRNSPDRLHGQGFLVEDLYMPAINLGASIAIGLSR